MISPAASASTGRSVLGSVVARQRRRLIPGALLLMGHQIGESLVPVIAGAAIDRSVAGNDPAALVAWLVALAAVFAMLSTSFRWGDRLLERAIEEAAHDLRLDLTGSVLHPRGATSSPAAPARRSGELVSIASSDADGTANVLAAVAVGAAGVVALAFAAAVLLWISPPLGLVVLLGLPPVLAALQLLVGPMERRVADQQTNVARAAATATDLLRGLRVVKGVGAEAVAADRYRAASNGSLSAAVRSARLKAAHEGITVAVTGSFLALVALVGGRLAADGSIGIGDLVAAVGLSQFLVGPLTRLGYAGAALASARASAERIAAVLAGPGQPPPRDGDRDGEDDDGVAFVAPIAGRLSLRSVTHDTLQGLSLDITAGELVGVAATSSSDALALLACLGREADPATGTIELDGLPLRRIDWDAALGAVLVARHDADLFGGSVLDNVMAARPDLRSDGEQVATVLTAAAADSVVAALPDGLDTPLTELGRSLSGGERQRVALARALATDAPVLVVHDPTTAVDAATEARIAAGLRAARAGRTTLVVATSPALLAVADRVVLVDGGRVAAAGSHDDLVRDEPRYRELVLA